MAGSRGRERYGDYQQEYQEEYRRKQRQKRLSQEGEEATCLYCNEVFLRLKTTRYVRRFCHECIANVPMKVRDAVRKSWWGAGGCPQEPHVSSASDRCAVPACCQRGLLDGWCVDHYGRRSDFLTEQEAS